MNERPVGVLDSGLGGLTFVREMETLLPGESIVYYGDNANCPYCNRPREEILNLSISMLDLLQKQNVKIAAIACNTISIVADELRKHYEFPIVSIIEEVCEYTAGLKLAQVGLFATEFTISQGLYTTLIQRLSPETKVFGVSSRSLAALVDKGRFNAAEIVDEVRSLLNTLTMAHPEVEHIILGCTHYPIVLDLFEDLAPGLTFINPAWAQAKAVETLLSGRALLADSTHNATEFPAHENLEIFTSGEKLTYETALKKLDIKRQANFTIV